MIKNKNFLLPKKIDYRFKLLYAIGIFFVVSGHCSEPIKVFSDWFPLYSFHLALFIFASAYFYKSENEKNISKYVFKKIKTLIIPLYLWNFFYAVFTYYTHKFGFKIGNEISFYSLFIEPWFGGYQFVYNLGGWFVAPLFAIQIFNIFIRVSCRKVNIDKWKYYELMHFFLFLFLGLLGILFAILKYNPSFILLYRCAYFMPFWGLGRLYKICLEQYDKKIPSIIYFSFIFFIQILIAYNYGFTNIPRYVAAWCKNFDGIFMPIIVGFTGIAFWWRISQILAPSIGKNKYINIIADHAYSVMINQMLGFFLVKLFFAVVHFNGFSNNAFKNNVWWYFYPNNCKYVGLIYLIAGIVVPIYMQKSISYIREYCLYLIKYIKIKNSEKFLLSRD